jgi:hypothetical protein
VSGRPDTAKGTKPVTAAALAPSAKQMANTPGDGERHLPPGAQSASGWCLSVAPTPVTRQQ